MGVSDILQTIALVCTSSPEKEKLLKLLYLASHSVKTMGGSDIPESNKLHPSKEHFEVSVSTVGGKTSAFWVKPATTVHELKVQIQGEGFVPQAEFNEIGLAFDGLLLEDDDCLNTRGIHEHTALTLVVTAGDKPPPFIRRVWVKGPVNQELFSVDLDLHMTCRRAAGKIVVACGLEVVDDWTLKHSGRILDDDVRTLRQCRISMGDVIGLQSRQPENQTVHS